MTQPESQSYDLLLSQEWQLLQQQHEQIERGTLGLKLFAVGMTFISLAVAVDLLMVGALLLVLWLQEAIVRTGQTRLGARILQLEASLRQQTGAVIPFQLHTDWHATRGGMVALLMEYGRHALRPTIAISYVLLLMVLLAALSTPVA